MNVSSPIYDEQRIMRKTFGTPKHYTGDHKDHYVESLEKTGDTTTQSEQMVNSDKRKNLKAVRRQFSNTDVNFRNGRQ